jgi:ribosomal protein S18 acetylase RimI-like enzyme
LPFIKKAGVQQYLLEVLQHNTKAVKVYRTLGFKETREFYYSLVSRDLVKVNSPQLSANYQLKQLCVQDCLAGASFHDFAPSWQNSFEAVLRKPNDFSAFGAFYADSLVGYCITEPQSGDITQIAVDKKHRRRGLGSALLARALDIAESDKIKVVNTDVQADEFTSFLASHNIKPSGKQFEMVRSIR